MYTNERIATWLDAQHQYEGIVLRQQLQTVLHAVPTVTIAMAVMARLTLHREVAESAMAVVVVGPVVVPDHAGQKQVRLCCTRQLK